MPGTSSRRALAEQHTPRAIAKRLEGERAPSYLHDFIYGAIDGAITTFAVVAGVQGAQLDETVVIILGVANLIAADAATELSLPSHCTVGEGDVIVNARVACDPAMLESHVRQAVNDVCGRVAATPEFREVQSFRPGRPEPTHRYADAI